LLSSKFIRTHSESDGHLSYLVRHVAATLGGRLKPAKVSQPASPASSNYDTRELASLLCDYRCKLPLVPVRNSDMRELTLLVPLQSLRRASCSQQSLVSLASYASYSRLDLASSGASIDSDSENDEIPLVFAAAYGFRNIQGVVSRLRRSATSAGSPTPPFAFVEVMACPSGCVNGGGLPRSDAISHNADGTGVAASYSTTAGRIRDVSSLVHDKAGRGEDISPPSDPRTTVARLLRAVPLLRELAEGDSKDGLAWLLRTRFHALPRTEGLGVRW